MRNLGRTKGSCLACPQFANATHQTCAQISVHGSFHHCSHWSGNPAPVAVSTPATNHLLNPTGLQRQGASGALWSSSLAVGLQCNEHGCRSPASEDQPVHSDKEALVYIDVCRFTTACGDSPKHVSARKGNKIPLPTVPLTACLVARA